MPQGARHPHPGDPLPRWAPIGKVARLGLVVAVVAGVVIALAVIVARPAEAADAIAGPPGSQNPSSAPWFGGRVEMPERGFSVTVPDRWWPSTQVEAWTNRCERSGEPRNRGFGLDVDASRPDRAGLDPGSRWPQAAETASGGYPADGPSAPKGGGSPSYTIPTHSPLPICSPSSTVEPTYCQPA